MAEDAELLLRSAVELAAAIREGTISSEQLVRACNARIAEIEDTIQAWQHHDPEYALEQARAADLAHQEGRGTGPLHGVPVAVKDIFDTEDMPTENGSPLHAGRQPRADATVVALLRQAGAVILGKTVTTEFAFLSPGKTRNPHNPEHTPGGSSSGSAAAVAAHMVPLGTGSQTNGSVIRPASYCGVVGYKPSHGLISRRGVLALSRVLDHVGVFGRTVEDAALIAEVLMAYDDRDLDMKPRARPRLLAAAQAGPPVTPRLAFVKSPVWNEAAADTQEAFAELADALGENVEEVALPSSFDDAVDAQQTIMAADMALNLAREYRQGGEKLSEAARAMIERGLQQKAADYNRAVARIADYRAEIDALSERYTAILTPASTGEAPHGLDRTGSPIFCSIWTLCGVPAVSVPILQGTTGLPLGVQLVAPYGDDARLLGVARWLGDYVSGAA